MALNILFLACVAAALGAFLAKEERTLRLVAGVGSTVIAALSVYVTIPILAGAPLDWQNVWYLDAFAALLFLLVGVVQWTATLVSLPYIRTELHEKIITQKQARLYYLLVSLFVLSMLLTLASNNLGVLWVALEGTTLATTMLVAFYTHEGSLEAAWKYIVLCSVGISLGLLGEMYINKDPKVINKIREIL